MKNEKSIIEQRKLYNKADMALFLRYRDAKGNKISVYRPQAPKPKSREK